MDCPCEQSTKLPLQTIGYLSRFGHGLRPCLSKMGSYEPIVDLSKRIESHQDFAWAAEQTLKSPQTLGNVARSDRHNAALRNDVVHQGLGHAQHAVNAHAFVNAVDVAGGWTVVSDGPVGG